MKFSIFIGEKNLYILSGQVFRMRSDQASYVFEYFNMTRGNYRNRLKLSLKFHLSDSNDAQLY